MWPAVGSIAGGTILNISGNYFDDTDAPLKVTVGGMYLIFYVKSIRIETIIFNIL